MADAKIMTFGELFSATTDVIPDNKAAAGEIEGLDGKDYIKIDTTDGSEAVKLVSSGMDGGVVLGTAALLKTAPDSGKAMKALQISTPATGAEPYNAAMVRFTQEDKGEGQDDGAWIGLTHQNTFSIGAESPIYISTKTAGTAILINNDATTAFYKEADFRDGLIVSSGDVGIGTTDPDTLLTLEDGGLGAQYSTDLVMLRNPASAASMINTRTNISFRQQTHGGSLEGSGRIQVGTETNWTGTASTQDSFMGFSISDEGTLTEAMRISSAGNVGIGTPSPSAQFHLQKDAGDAVVLLQCNDASFGVDEIYGKIDFGNRNFDDRICSIVAAQEAACDSAATANGYLAFYTEASGGAIGERMRIDSAGNVGIAMTPGGSHKIDVTGSAGLSTGTAWTNTSDSRVKKNIESIDNALEKIEALRPVSFEYTEDYIDCTDGLIAGQRYNSFIAQEYAQVFPNAVSNRGDVVKDFPNGDSRLVLQDVQQFTPHDLNMYLVRAVQELSAQVKALKEGN